MSHAELAERLHSAAIHLVRRVATVDAGGGLSPARHSALAVIVDQGPLTMTDLARIEQVSAATASSTVGGLEAAHLVTRGKCGTDARTVAVRATDAGRRVLAERRLARLALLQSGLTSLSTRDRQALARAVDVLDRLLSQPRSLPERLPAGDRQPRSVPEALPRLPDRDRQPVA